MAESNVLAALAEQPDQITVRGVVVTLNPLNLYDIARLGAQHQETIKAALDLLGKHATTSGIDLAGLLKAAPDILELINRFPALSADVIAASVSGGDVFNAARLSAGVQVALLGAIWKRLQNDLALVADTLGNPKAGGQSTGQTPSPDATNASLQKAIRQAITQPPAQP